MIAKSLFATGGVELGLALVFLLRWLKLDMLVICSILLGCLALFCLVMVCL